MQDKEYYRQYFLSIKPYVKLKTFCSACNIHDTALSSFLNGKDDQMSIVNLDRLQSLVKLSLKNLL